MASATIIPSPLPTVSKSSPFFSSLPIPYSKNRSLTLIPHHSLSTWNGLRNNGFSISLKSLKFEKKSRKGVFASLFGVGAPEALVIGVVALLVFGPKGLAEIAKNLGKTLRAFQPTIRELQEVSREFKSTLEKEIGLDEIQNSARSNISPTLSKQDSDPTERLFAAVREESRVAAAKDDASREESQVVVTTTEEDSPLVGEDSQVATTAAGEDSSVVGEDSQVATTAAGEDSPVVVVTTIEEEESQTKNDSKSNSVEQVGVGNGMHSVHKSEE